MAVVQVLGAASALGSLGEGGFFASIADSIGKAGDWFSKNSGQMVQALDAYGRLKGQTNYQTNEVNEAWRRDVLNTPGSSWFDQSTVFPGIQNSVVAMGGAAALGLVLFLVLRKPEVAR